MIDSEMGTQHFKTISENPQDAQTILLCVYHALSAKGYDPITQIVGYLISGDPTYITGYQNARSLIAAELHEYSWRECLEHDVF